jgi:hypothetical protein
VSEAAVGGAGLDDLAGEGEPVDDCGADPGSMKVFGQPENGSLEAIADLQSWPPEDMMTVEGLNWMVCITKSSRTSGSISSPDATDGPEAEPPAATIPDTPSMIAKSP